MNRNAEDYLWIRHAFNILISHGFNVSVNRKRKSITYIIKKGRYRRRIRFALYDEVFVEYSTVSDYGMTYFTYGRVTLKNLSLYMHHVISNIGAKSRIRSIEKAEEACKYCASVEVRTGIKDYRQEAKDRIRRNGSSMMRDIKKGFTLDRLALLYEIGTMARERGSINDILKDINRKYNHNSHEAHCFRAGWETKKGDD